MVPSSHCISHPGFQVLAGYHDIIVEAIQGGRLVWIGYLSTTSE